MIINSCGFPKVTLWNPVTCPGGSSAAKRVDEPSHKRPFYQGALPNCWGAGTPNTGNFCLWDKSGKKPPSHFCHSSSLQQSHEGRSQNSPFTCCSTSDDPAHQTTDMCRRKPRAYEPGPSGPAWPPGAGHPGGCSPPEPVLPGAESASLPHMIQDLVVSIRLTFLNKVCDQMFN